MYILDINFLLDVITDRSKNKYFYEKILEYLINKKEAYISSSALHNIRFILKRNYRDYLSKYLEIEKQLNIVKTPSYIDYNDKLCQIDIEDYLLELSAKTINAKVITNDKTFLKYSEIAVSPAKFLSLSLSTVSNIDFANLKKQHIRYSNEIEKSVDNVYNHARFIMGPEIKELENNLCNFTDAKNAITCGSGTDALLLAMMALDIKPDDEIITTPFTFIATAETIAFLGAKPVFVDIDEETYNIDVNKIEKEITPKTKAILPVSLFGQPCDLEELQSLITNHQSLYLIIDGAQSFGATYKGKAEVHYCDIYTTSFFPAKPLGCYGDGGAVFTNNDELADKIKMLRIHGQNKRYSHKYVGLGARLDTIQAATLNVKLKHYPEDLKKRQEVAQKYTNLFSTTHSPITHLPIHPSDRTSAWAQYSIRVKDRDEVQEKLKEAGIPTAVHYPKPLHLQECFSYLGYKEGDFPVAEKISKEIMSLPMNPDLTDKEIEYIADKVIEFAK